MTETTRQGLLLAAVVLSLLALASSVGLVAAAAMVARARRRFGELERRLGATDVRLDDVERSLTVKMNKPQVLLWLWQSEAGRKARARVLGLVEENRPSRGGHG